MKNKQITMIVMALLLVGLIAAYLAVSSSFPDESESTDTTAEDTYVSVNSIEEDSIVAVSFTNGGAEYSFSLSSEVWSYTADASFPVDPEAMGDITSALSGIRAQRAFDADTKSAEYGLDEPLHVIKVTLSAGGTLTYNIGDYNKHSDTYYMTASGHDKVYMVSADFRELFAGELYDLLKKDTTPTVNAEDISLISAVLPGQSTELKLEQGTEDSETVWTHTNINGAAAKLETATAEKIAAALAFPSLSDCVDHNAQDSELSAYGLLPEQRTRVTVKYNVKVDSATADATSIGGSTVIERELSYYIGKTEAPAAQDTAADTASGNTALADADTSADNASDSNAKKTVTYVMLEGSNMVYKVDISSAEVFFS